MKHFTVFLTFLFSTISFDLSAQYDYNYYWAFEVNYLLENAEKFGDSSVFEVKMHSVYKKKVKNYIYKFNEKGKLIEFYKGKNTDSIEKKALITYDEKNRIEKAKFYDKHKLDLQFNYVFNDSDKLVELKKTDKEEKIIVLRKLKYNSDGFIEESSHFIKNSSEPRFEWKYEYYDKGKLAHSYWYKKGKLKREWDYLCKEEGEEMKQRKLSNVCQWYESDKDTLTAIYQTTNSKGKVQKSIYKYTVKDTLLLAQIHYNSKNEISSKWTYDKSYNKILSRTFYHKNKITSQMINTYLGDKYTSITYKKKGKLKYREEFNYNEMNQLISTKSFNRKDELVGESNINYTMRN